MNESWKQPINALDLRPTTGATPMPAKLPPEVLDRFYQRVLGFMYQVLGDAELAAQATQAVFLRRRPPTEDVAVWQTALAVVHQYLARGFLVRPLTPLSHSWQAELLRGLAQLDPLDRALLLLRYHEGLDIALLGQVLRLDERVVRERTAAARAKLLDVMDDA